MSDERRRVLIAIALCGALASCSRSGPRPVQQDVPSSPPTVDVVRVVERPVSMMLSMPGELDPYQAVAVYPKVTGFVKTIQVDRGSRVRAGQTLAVLEAPELVARRAEARSKLNAAEALLAAARAKAEADVGTYDKLKAASATPGAIAGNDLLLAQKAMDADRSQMAAAQGNVEAARQAMNAVTQLAGYLTVRAPFDGIVTERHVHPGALVGPGSGSGSETPLVRLVHNRRLRLVVPVPEAYAADITPGVVVSFTVAAYPGERFSGTVARIAHDVDVKTRTMAVELDVENGDGRLASGTFCQVAWPVRRSTPSLLVPSGSVASTTERTFVVRVRNGRAEWVDVETGLTSGSLVEVFGDLRAGDEVAARGTDEMAAGARVRAREVRVPTTS
jgi:RND family efflux transporter MFP subunit